MLAVETRGLTRRFEGGQGVHALDLQVPAGGVYGFLGPNGAGKSTTIRLLLGLLRADEGSIDVFGQRVSWHERSGLASVGSLVESPSLYPHLSARDNLEVTRRLAGIERSRVDQALDMVGLLGDAHRRVATFSLGMRQRLGIALALLHRPRLLVLDEPTNGLDPAGIVELRTLIQGMAREAGMTVFLSSHLLSEVEQMATHVGVLHQGRLLFEGSQADLRQRYGDPLTIQCSEPLSVCASLHQWGEHAKPVDANTVAVGVPQRPDWEINRWLTQQGFQVHAFGRRPRSLEALFFELTQAQVAA